MNKFKKGDKIRFRILSEKEFNGLKQIKKNYKNYSDYLFYIGDDLIGGDFYTIYYINECGYEVEEANVTIYFEEAYKKPYKRIIKNIIKEEQKFKN